MYNSLLIQEPPLQVLPSLAIKIGLNEAIALQQLHYWLRINKEADKSSTHFYKDRWWAYNTIEQWKDTNFPFWSESTVKRTFNNLEGMGLVHSAYLSEDKRDRTKWYTIDYETLQSLDNASGQNDQMLDQVKMTKWKSSDCPDDLYTETNSTETNSTETNSLCDEQKKLFEDEQPAVVKKTKRERDLEKAQPFLEFYNAHRGASWIKTRSVSDRTLINLRKLVASEGSWDLALEAFQLFIPLMSADGFWGGTANMNLERVLRVDNYEQFLVKALEQNTQQKSIPGTLEKPAQEFEEYVNENGYIKTLRGYRLPHSPNTEIFSDPPSTPYVAPQTSGTGPSPAEVKRRMDQLQRIMGSK